MVFANYLVENTNGRKWSSNSEKFARGLLLKLQTVQLSPRHFLACYCCVKMKAELNMTQIGRQGIESKHTFLAIFTFHFKTLP